MRCVRRDRDIAGLTLVELMIGAALCGMIGVSVYHIFSQALRVEQQMMLRVKFNRKMFDAVHSIARDMDRMIVYTTPEHPQGYFSGRANEIAFVILEEGAMKEVRYDMIVSEISPMADNGQTTGQEKQFFLVRKTRRFPHVYQGEQGFEQNVIIAGHGQGELQFFYSDHRSDALRQWTSVWNNENCPSAVRVDLTLSGCAGISVRVIKEMMIPLPAHRMERLYAQQ